MHRHSRPQKRPVSSIMGGRQYSRVVDPHEQMLRRQPTSYDLNRRASAIEEVEQYHTMQGASLPVFTTSSRPAMALPGDNLEVGKILPRSTHISLAPAPAESPRINTSRCVRRVSGTPSLFSQFSADGGDCAAICKVLAGAITVGNDIHLDRSESSTEWSDCGDVSRKYDQEEFPVPTGRPKQGTFYKTDR